MSPDKFRFCSQFWFFTETICLTNTQDLPVIFVEIAVRRSVQHALLRMQLVWPSIENERGARPVGYSGQYLLARRSTHTRGACLTYLSFSLPPVARALPNRVRRISVRLVGIFVPPIYEIFLKLNLF